MPPTRPREALGRIVHSGAIRAPKITSALDAGTGERCLFTHLGERVVACTVERPRRRLARRRVTRRPAPDLSQRPGRVGAHQRLGIAGEGTRQRRDRGGLATVAERDAHVARESGAPRATDRAAREQHPKAGLVEREEALEGPALQRSGVKSRLVGGRGEAIPWADLLAHVAAKDPVADRGAQLARDRSAVLDGEVGDAAPRVHLVGRDDRLGGTGLETARARSAMLALERAVRFELAIHQYLGQHEPRAQLGREHPRVLADPSQTRALRPRALQNRAGVRVPQAPRSRQACFDLELETRQLVAHHAVIVLADRVARHAPQTPIELRVARRLVAERDAHHRAHAGEDQRGVAAPLALPLGREPRHVAVATGGEPCLVAGVRLQRLDARDPDRRETELVGARLDALAGRRVQPPGRVLALSLAVGTWGLGLARPCSTHGRRIGTRVGAGPPASLSDLACVEAVTAAFRSSSSVGGGGALEDAPTSDLCATRSSSRARGSRWPSARSMADTEGPAGTRAPSTMTVSLTGCVVGTAAPS